MHTETALRNAIFQSVQRCDLAVCVIDEDAHALVVDGGVVLEFLGETVVVGCEEADAADVTCYMVENSFGHSHAIVGACAAAELVKDNKRAGRSFGEDFLGLRQLDEEG